MKCRRMWGAGDSVVTAEAVGLMSSQINMNFLENPILKSNCTWFSVIEKYKTVVIVETIIPLPLICSFLWIKQTKKTRNGDLNRRLVCFQSQGFPVGPNPLRTFKSNGSGRLHAQHLRCVGIWAPVSITPLPL